MVDITVSSSPVPGMPPVQATVPPQPLLAATLPPVEASAAPPPPVETSTVAFQKTNGVDFLQISRQAHAASNTYHRIENAPRQPGATGNFTLIASPENAATAPIAPPSRPTAPVNPVINLNPQAAPRSPEGAPYSPFQDLSPGHRIDFTA